MPATVFVNTIVPNSTMIDAPAYCTQCQVVFDAPTTGKLNPECPFCANQLVKYDAQ